MWKVLAILASYLIDPYVSKYFGSLVLRVFFFIKILTASKMYLSILCINFEVINKIRK